MVNKLVSVTVLSPAISFATFEHGRRLDVLARKFEVPLDAVSLFILTIGVSHEHSFGI